MTYQIKSLIHIKFTEPVSWTILMCPRTYVTIRVEVTAGGERADRALPCLSSIMLVPVKILPLPAEVLSRAARCTMAMSPATSEDGSKIEIRNY